jgi:hypothetical protein
LNGTYFFAGTVSFGSNITVTGTATLLLLPGASLSITGTPSIELKGQTSVASTSVPSALNTGTLLNLLSGMLLYDPESTGGNNGQRVNITGDATSYFDGVVYAPNADVTYTGSSVNSNSAVGCNEVIAKSIKYAGNTTYIDNSSCPVQTAPINYVALVQ